MHYTTLGIFAVSFSFAPSRPLANLNLNSNLLKVIQLCVLPYGRKVVDTYFD